MMLLQQRRGGKKQESVPEQQERITSSLLISLAAPAAHGLAPLAHGPFIFYLPLTGPASEFTVDADAFPGIAAAVTDVVVTATTRPVLRPNRSPLSFYPVPPLPPHLMPCGSSPPHSHPQHLSRHLLLHPRRSLYLRPAWRPGWASPPEICVWQR